MSLLMRSGKIVDVHNFTKESFNINDVIHGLPYINRFAGQTSHIYSVAKHSINVHNACQSLGVNAPTRLFALLHDAAEIYIGDIPSPVKSKLPEVNKLEDTINQVILEVYKKEFAFEDLKNHIDFEIINDVDKSITFQELNKFVVTNPILMNFTVKYIIPQTRILQDQNVANTIDDFTKVYNDCFVACKNYLKDKQDKIEEIPF